MKFTVSSKVLFDGLNKISGIVGTNNIISILDNFLFQLDNNILKVMSSDVENTMLVEIEVSSNDKGAIAVPAKKLLENLKYIPEQPLLVSINEDSRVLEFNTTNGNYKLAGFDANEFPKMPEIVDAKTVKMPSAVFEKAIQSTLFAIGNDDQRKAMTGMYCQFDQDGATFVSTDAQKLVRYKRRDVVSTDTFNFILPKKVLNQLKSNISGAQDELELIFNKNNCAFKIDKLYIICRLIDAVFPEYNNVIPTDNQNIMTVNREEVLNSLKRLAPFTNQSTHQINFKIEGSNLTTSASDIDFNSEGIEQNTIVYKGEDMAIGFNSKYLSEILQTIQNDEVLFEMSTPSRAALIFPTVEEENESMLMLIMPLMVNVI